MFKKMTAIMLLTACTSAVAEQKDLSFTVEANIPAARYYVQFENPAWESTTQTMDFNGFTVALDQISTNLRVKNTAGKIRAFLDSPAKLVHATNSAAEIPLTISIDGKVLSAGQAGSVDLTTAATATEELKPLAVNSGSSANFDVAGRYAGNITMMFDFDI